MQNKSGIPKKNKVDIVYIWCDSNNEEYIKNRAFFSKQYDLSTYWSPTRDHNEITHSIKSVRKYMKWVRNIFICAPKNHKIKNIDEKKYNIHYVSNEQILGEKNCPNFNSHTLELYIHKIPNLSEYYIQFMDDLFINEKVELEDFYNFETKKIKYYYENILMLGSPSSTNTTKIINNLLAEKYYFWATHSPKMFFKEDIVDITKNYKNNSEYTKKAKFRTQKDFQLVYFYGYYLLSKNKGDFIFLQNITGGNTMSSSIKVIFGKFFSENFFSVLYQIYLQIFYKKKLHKDKIFLHKNIYSLIHIGDDYRKNKSNIDLAIKNKIKFICINDSYNQKDLQLGKKIMKENYQYFYKKLLR